MIRCLRPTAVAGDVRSGVEVDIRAGQPGELGDPQPGLNRQAKQRVVTPPGIQVGGAQQDVHA